MYFLDEFFINTPFEVKNNSIDVMKVIQSNELNNKYQFTESNPNHKVQISEDDYFQFVAEKVKISKNASKT